MTYEQCLAEHYRDKLNAANHIISLQEDALDILQSQVADRENTITRLTSSNKNSNITKLRAIK